MSEDQRAPRVILEEMTPMLSILATRRLYREQPELWGLGDTGRARTIEDFNHHFTALTALDAGVFRAHVRYCRELFSSRGYPEKWLDDAWRWMGQVMREELPLHVADEAIDILHSEIEPGSAE